MAHAEDASNVNAQWPSLREYTEAHSALGNDCYWLHEFVSSDAISAGRISPKYLVRVCYKETGAASTIITKDFGTGSFALLDLRKSLAEKHVLAVILCHRDSSQVDPGVLDLLWTKLKLEVSFMRHHFDYKEFREEPGCPEVIRNHLKREEGLIEDEWTFGGRWNPIRLPSETRASILRLSVGSECLSVCCRGGIVIALIRSKAVYQEPEMTWTDDAGAGYERPSYSCAVDLFAATADVFFKS
ncbi:hypothetical protein JMJ35_002207 [Cladonia borealis]|uniref:Uncharacterized protein n=1 Tax=Cladonia borealis TaxID=184061 RepID=A0AA39V3M7_9LECA|nr:hypothetical protein JMJ35_002207 [Cladonia borealis]